MIRAPGQKDDVPEAQRFTNIYSGFIKADSLTEAKLGQCCCFKLCPYPFVHFFGDLHLFLFEIFCLRNFIYLFFIFPFKIQVRRPSWRQKKGRGESEYISLKGTNEFSCSTIFTVLYQQKKASRSWNFILASKHHLRGLWRTGLPCFKLLM